jgi:DNA polymerase III subunit delta
LAQIKTHEFDGYLARRGAHKPVILIYGPDRGLVSERAASVAEASGVALDDPFSAVRLDIGDLQGDAGRLVDEANALALFGGTRLVWLRGAGNERNLIEALTTILNDPPTSTLLVVEAGDLKKGAALRKLVEDAGSGMAIPCYADEAINGLIDDVLGREGLRIVADARQTLIALLGGDRLASRAEVEKLALYCRGMDVVTLEHVLDLIGDAAALSIDDAVDAVLLGDTMRLDMTIERIATSRLQLFPVLLACLRQFQMLDEVLARKQQGEDISGLLRRVHFKRKPAIDQALSVWTLASTGQALQHLNAAIFESRKRPALEESIVRQALLAMALRSRGRRR